MMRRLLKVYRQYRDTRVQRMNVDWMGTYVNDPTLSITVRKLPPHRTERWECRKGAYYLCQHRSGYSQHYYKLGDRQEDGFAGRHIPINMEDGTQRTLRGPWHVGTHEFTKCGWPTMMEVVVYQSEGEFPELGCASWWRVDDIKRLLRRHLPEWEVCEHLYPENTIRLRVNPITNEQAFTTYTVKRIGEPPKHEQLEARRRRVIEEQAG